MNITPDMAKTVSMPANYLPASLEIKQTDSKPYMQFIEKEIANLNKELEKLNQLPLLSKKNIQPLLKIGKQVSTSWVLSSLKVTHAIFWLIGSTFKIMGALSVIGSLVGVLADKSTHLLVFSIFTGFACGAGFYLLGLIILKISAFIFLGLERQYTHYNIQRMINKDKGQLSYQWSHLKQWSKLENLNSQQARIQAIFVRLHTMKCLYATQHDFSKTLGLKSLFEFEIKIAKFNSLLDYMYTQRLKGGQMLLDALGKNS